MSRIPLEVPMRFLRDALLTILILVVVIAVVGFFFLRNGLSAQTAPPRIEAAIAGNLRSLAIPSGAKRQQNPFASQSDTWRAGGAHFMDHCATCHGEDGRGKSEIGQRMYPKAPDMTRPDTQDLSDGALFFIIQNGVRYTGMPAWEGEHTPEETWHLVSFIRHLPKLTGAEIEQLSGEGEGSEHRHHDEENRQPSGKTK